MKIISITSPATDAGKTFIASGLAEAATAKGLKTLFIDFDSPVGDATRVFGTVTNDLYPTVTSWPTFENPWEYCLKSITGTYILPKPVLIQEIITKEIINNLLKEVEGVFDLIVCDLGTDFRADYWTFLIDKSDLALLVSDCDEKALVRIREFLEKAIIHPRRKWTLAVNSREQKGLYTTRQIIRILSENENIGDVIEVPHFKNIQKGIPKTFSPDEKFAASILEKALAGNDEKLINYEIDRQIKETDVIDETDNTEEELEIASNNTDAFYMEPSELAADFLFVDDKKENNISDLSKEKPYPDEASTSVKEENERILSCQIVQKEKSFAPRNLFVKTGYILDKKFYKLAINNPIEILDKVGACDAVVVTADINMNLIKDFVRDNLGRSNTTLLIVLNGTLEHKTLGADYCIKKINKNILSEVSNVAQRLRKLILVADTDPLTGLYRRKVMDEWLASLRARKTLFSFVMVDLDFFKKVNDTHGHPAGDAVLSAFGQFIKNNIRKTDIAFRYGGEEFVILLPYTDSNQAYQLVDRLRAMWEEREIMLPDSTMLKTTFSAGIAEWIEGSDVKQIADEMLYKAKNGGRNQVKANNIRTRALLLGEIPANAFRNALIDLTLDPEQATVVVTDNQSCAFAPKGILTYVLGTGEISDWLLKRERENIIICSTIEEIINLIKPKPNLQILPGVRTHEKSQTIPRNGVLYLVCPSRPAASGEIAARLANSCSNTALICAVAESTAALSIGIPESKLITSDWRMPLADAPVKWNGVYVWPVDPYKHISAKYNLHDLIDQIKNRFSLVLVDCGGSLEICSRTASDEGILLLYKEGDASDIASKHWINSYGRKNVLSMAPNENPTLVEAENGFIISCQNINYQNSHL